MPQEELIYKLFGLPQEKKLDLHLKEIDDILTKQTDKVTIDVREIDWYDPRKRLDDPTYLDDEMLKFTDTGISILYATDKTVEMLKDKLPRTVTELTIPSEFLKDIAFLQQFPNLETLNISDYSTFPPEVIDFIANNTSIKNMTFRSSGTLNNLKCLPGCNIIEAGNMIGQYGKLTLFNQGYSGKWNSNMKIYTSEYSKKNLATLEALYDGISPYIEKLENVSIMRNAESVFYSDFDMTITDKKVSKMTIKNTTPTEAARVYKGIAARTEIKKTQFNLENKTYDDIYQLKQMNDTSTFSIRYHNGGDSSDASYDEFLNMRATIDYYKELIEANDLSPVEKIAYIYDILKTMRYQENKQDKQRSRNIHSIVTDGTIVCVGYSAFAKQLLNELGIKCLNVGVTCLSDKADDEGHARNLLRVDDDKYNIHGLFAMDITWDSDRDVAIIDENGEKTIVSRPTEEMKDKIVDKYDSLVLYRHFLIPMETYEQRYPEEINPQLYEAYKAGKAKELTEESRKISSGEMRKSDSKNIYVLNQHQTLFDQEEGPLTVQRYFEAPKPSLETFEQILSTIRQAQGYTPEETKSEVERVVELHQMLAEQNKGTPNNFFKPSTK